MQRKFLKPKLGQKKNALYRRKKGTRAQQPSQELTVNSQKKEKKRFKEGKPLKRKEEKKKRKNLKRTRARGE